MQVNLETLRLMRIIKSPGSCAFVGIMDHLDHCVLWFSAVPSLRPAVVSTTTETNERIKMGLTETGTAGSLLCFIPSCLCS